MNISYGNFDPVQMQGTIEKVLGFDLNTLWQLSFGYKGLPFPANILSSGIPGLSGVRRASDKKNLYSSRTGVPFYEEINGRLSFMPVWIDDNLLPITRLGISRRKVINETAITSSSGTVKELIRADDYNITIQGLAFGHDKIFPEDELAMIERLVNENKSLSIRSAVTDMFLQDGYVVITDLNLPPPRTEHVQPYELKLLSDEMFDLIIE